MKKMCTLQSNIEYFLIPFYFILQLQLSITKESQYLLSCKTYLIHDKVFITIKINS